jgi:hypothetical protein
VSSPLLLAALDPILASHLVSAARLVEKRGFLPTGAHVLDGLLGGGWPRGAVAEVSGKRSSGRTSLVLGSLSAAQARGEATALVDTGDALDPRRAARAGIDLARLLWVRASGAEALKAADLIVAAGGLGLLALDLGDRNEPRSRRPDAAWIRLARAAEKQGTAVLISAPWRRLGTFAAAALVLRADPRWHGRGAARLLDGIETRVELLRARTRAAAPPADEPRVGFRAG